MLLTQLLIGTIALIITVIIHATILDKIMKHGSKIESIAIRFTGKQWKITFISIVILIVFSSHIIQMWLWAFLYLGITDEFNNVEQALYFSVSSFTTVGFGDVILGEKWRMLSGIEASNGFLLFGWSTAFIFEIIVQIYRREAEKLKKN